MALELYGTASCSYTAELREWLLAEGCEFVEFDVEENAEAHRRLFATFKDARLVPVLIEDGRLIMAGWRGRGCFVAPPARAASDACP